MPNHRRLGLALSRLGKSQLAVSAYNQAQEFLLSWPPADKAELSEAIIKRLESNELGLPPILDRNAGVREQRACAK